MQILNIKTIGLLMLTLILGGCDLFNPPVDTTIPPDDDTSVVSSNKLIAEKAIYSDASNSSEHLANIELWMDGSPRQPRIVLTAVVDLTFFDINMTLPVCYVFPRPHGEMSGWRGGPLEAGKTVEIESRWDQISDSCEGDFATVLWNISTQFQGSKDNLTVPWDWPEN